MARVATVFVTSRPRITRSPPSVRHLHADAATASSDPGLGALAVAEARRTHALGLTERTQTTIHHYQTRRITAK